MKSKYILILAGLLVILAGCNDRGTQPPVLNNVQPEPVPEAAERILNDYQLTGDDWPGSTPMSMPSMQSVTTGEYDIYSITFLWGDFINRVTPVVQPVDWSGKLSINAVANIRTTCEIDFEPGEDSLVPVNCPSAMAWVSQTTGDFDGLSFLLFVQRDVAYFAVPELVFETSPITLRFTLDQLVRLIAYYPVSNLGGVVVHSRMIWQNTCRGGFIEGKWIKEENDSRQGRIEGIWLDREGNPFGHMTGRFWTTERNLREFAGTVSGIYTDHIIAEFKGVWNYDDPRMCPLCGEGHGLFRGQFQLMTEEGGGKLFGEFGDLSLALDQKELPIRGIWKMNCTLADPNDILPTTN